MPKLLTATKDGEAVMWKTPYNHDRDKENTRLATHCPEKSRTQQSFKDQQDINTIVARVLKTGELPNIPAPPQYEDLTTRQDYHTMLNRIAETNGLFYKLDAELRAEYNNDPGSWLQDVNEKINAGELQPLREMGLDMKSVDAQIEALKAKAQAAKAEQAKTEAEAAAAAKASKAASQAAKT